MDSATIVEVLHEFIDRRRKAKWFTGTVKTVIHKEGKVYYVLYLIIGIRLDRR
jgi:hypothetical protein